MHPVYVFSITPTTGSNTVDSGLQCTEFYVSCNSNKKPPHLISMFCYDSYRSRQVTHGYITIFNFKKYTVYVEFSVDTVMMGQLFC